MTLNIRNVLVVDDELLMREFVGETLKRLGCEVRFAVDGTQAVRFLEKESFDLVFTDMKLPKLSGLEVLKRSKLLHPATEVVVMTAYGTVENAVSAMQQGAVDYLLKPFTPEQVELLVEKISSTLSLKAQNAYYQNVIQESFGFGEIIGSAKVMKDTYDTIRKIASSRASVLIQGKSGTGKELVARAIHQNGDRKDKPFIKLNCAALPANLIESELFGHEKGAFTGANTQRIGRFELADGGTIFLDEISEVEPGLQAKLLRVLQEREFERVGSSRTIQVDVRIIASTNRDLKEAIRKGEFREDLFFRLNVVPITLPLLRDRREDILILAEHFLIKFTRENKKGKKNFSPEARQELCKYDWPGNVRELENVIERSVVMDRDSVILPGDLGLRASGTESRELKADETFQVGQKIQDIERHYILRTLAECENNRTRTAQILDISIRTLRNKLGEYKKQGFPVPE